MNDRKRAWQLLHIEIRRRADSSGTDETWATQFGTIIREADSLDRVIIELAGFGATFALMGDDSERAKRVADKIGARVMQEPDDDTPDYDDDSRTD